MADNRTGRNERLILAAITHQGLSPNGDEIFVDNSVVFGFYILVG